MTDPKIGPSRRAHAHQQPTEIIPAVSNIPPGGKVVEAAKAKPSPLAFLAFVVFLASINAAVWMAELSTPWSVAITGTSASLLLLVLSGGLQWRKP